MNVFGSCRYTWWLALVLAGHAAPVAGNVVVDRTRIIFPATDREVSVALRNEGEQTDSPFLIQSWVDEGTAQVSAETSQAPFIIVPPVLRIDGGARSVLRIRALPAHLPGDRESLFWLHVLAIPTKPAVREDEEEVMQLAVDTRLKLFWRPQGLDGSAESAPRNLIWTQAALTGQACAVHVENPSPYHVTLVELAVAGRNVAVPIAGSGLMLPPRSSKQIALSCAADALPAKPRISFSTVDDSGAVAAHLAELRP